ncbi:MAG: DUF4411 family protein [Acidobacteria bacterium]|nr:DUF4411 family protein [Acidobacteriota bacterium]MYA46682.1 DUF4411 family protein [Acidobacteriota bacterium]MYI39235.1 DUF4411 family protein [Acidobacteriota bacterium]
MAYLLDANVLIAAKNLHYGFDFCPGFWDWIVVGHARGLVRSIDKVGDEIGASDDELREWAKQRGPEFFVLPQAADLPSLERVSEWVREQSYDPAAINSFLQAADYYLVGQALTGGHAVVTHEVPADTPRRIKIPNVCIGLGVKCVTPFAMLRAERARFVLDSNGADAQKAAPGSLFGPASRRSS